MSSELIQRLNDQPIVYQGQRCVTLDLIDHMHERKKGTANDAFKRRRDKFTEGKHFHCVPYHEWSQGDAGRGLKPQPGGGHRGDRIYLTEKGYCLIAKTFDDDRAWAIQEELVDGYFRQQSQTAEPLTAIAAVLTQVANALTSMNARIDRLEAGQLMPYGPTFPIRQRLTEMLAIQELGVSESWKGNVVKRIVGEASMLHIDLSQRPAGMTEMPISYLPWAECLMKKYISMEQEKRRTPLFNSATERANASRLGCVGV